MYFRPILHILGILLLIVSLSMCIPMLTDLFFGNADWITFFICILITAFFGGAMAFSTSGDAIAIDRRQGFMLIVLCWVAIPLFASLPLWFAYNGLGFTDAFFESVSAITTTGSTVMAGLDYTPPGILLWRALLQWLGGIGIILMAMSILPFLKVGGMQMFQTELSESEKVMPRAKQFAASIGIIYIALTAMAVIAYHIAGMSVFDSVIHALTTLSTGGFSSHDASFSAFEQPSIQYIAVLFMILGGLPFILYLKAVRGNITPLLSDSQVIWFLLIVSAGIISLTAYLIYSGHAGFSEALRLSSFNVVSIVTGTGFTNGDYNAWGHFTMTLLLFMMMIGACAGSTTCGIKVFRFQILYAVSVVQIKQLMHPSGVLIPHFKKRPIPKSAALSVMGFFFMYVLCFAMLAVMLSLSGLDLVTSVSGAATSISNVGPGLGDTIGPSGNFASLSDMAKWILCAGMLLGRLELFPILVMLSPQFWQR